MKHCFTSFPLDKVALVIDDSDEAISALRNILGGIIAVKGFSSMESLTEYLGNDKCRVDIIFINVTIADMDGFEVLSVLNGHEIVKDVPKIMITGGNAIDEEIKSFNMGAEEFIYKPYVNEVVRSRTLHVLEIDHLKRHLSQKVNEKTQNLKVAMLENKKMFMSCAHVLSLTIDANHPYTYGHSRRVANIARIIGENSGMGQEELNRLYVSGLLHDIGKISTPNEILNKPERLTDLEFDIIREHPVIGYEILKDFKEFDFICEVVRWHHERYDGTGYPDGLKGDEIPKTARIVAVADAYDAMATKRAYNSVRPVEDIIKELLNGRGTQFDPYYVDILIDILEIESGREAIKRQKDVV